MTGNGAEERVLPRLKLDCQRLAAFREDRSARSDLVDTEVVREGGLVGELDGDRTRGRRESGLVIGESLVRIGGDLERASPAGSGAGAIVETTAPASASQPRRCQPLTGSR